MDLMDIAFVIAGIMVITFIYMAFPLFCLVFKDGQYEKKMAKRIALWNSIICGLILLVLIIVVSDDWNIYEVVWSPISALLFYWINRKLLADTSKGISKETVDPKEPNREELLLLYELFYEKQKQLDESSKTLENIKNIIEKVKEK